MKFKALLLSSLLVFSFVLLGQTKPVRKYKTYTPTPMRSAPSPNAAKIGTIPKDRVVVAIEKENYWVKVKVDNVEGWVAATLMERLNEGPAVAELVFNGGDYKIINGVHRYFFAVRNDGLAGYKGKLIARLYTGEKVILENVYTFAEKPMEADTGRTFHLDIPQAADRYEFVTDDEKIEKKTGRLIEVINDK